MEGARRSPGQLAPPSWGAVSRSHPAPPGNQRRRQDQPVPRARRPPWNYHRVADDPAVRFLVAAPGEVLAVLDEASAWLAGRGVEQWPSRFEPSWVEGAVRRGETWLALAG